MKNKNSLLNVSFLMSIILCLLSLGMLLFTVITSEERSFLLYLSMIITAASICLCFYVALIRKQIKKIKNEVAELKCQNGEVTADKYAHPASPGKKNNKRHETETSERPVESSKKE